MTLRLPEHDALKRHWRKRSSGAGRARTNGSAPGTTVVAHWSGEDDRQKCEIGCIHGTRLRSAAEPIAYRETGLTPEQILTLCAVPAQTGLFVLGALDDRLTLRSQQVRALNLSYALRMTYGSGTRLAVVGAGIGGVTVACALALGGHQVLVLEREPHPMHLYARANHRWIHPRVLSWPGYEVFGNEARLPLYNWIAGDAATVTKRWRSEFALFRDAFRDSLSVIVRAQDVDVHPRDRKFEITWNEPQFPARHEDVDLVVLCVGYGTDDPIGEFRIANRSYWTPDSLDTFGPRQDILISGIGDGGLLDLFRATLLDFEPAAYLAETIEPHLTPEMYAELRSVEERTSASGRDGLSRYYDTLRVDEIVEGLKRRRRHDTTVFLNSPSGSLFSPKASALNRFLLSQLRCAEGFQYLCGSLGSLRGEQGKWTVEINGRPRSFDHVIVRHGPQAELQASFPGVARGLAPVLHGVRRAYDVDPLRKELWPQDFFEVAEKDPTLSASIASAAGKWQLPDEGVLYAGGDLFLEFGSQFVRIPAERSGDVLFEDDRGRIRHLKYSRVTRRPIRQSADLPKDADFYGD